MSEFYEKVCQIKDLYTIERSGDPELETDKSGRPTFFVRDYNRGSAPDETYVEIAEEHILVHPVVVEALRKARDEAYDARFDTSEVAKKVEEYAARHPRPLHHKVRFVRHVIFQGTYEAVLKQLACSLPAGKYGQAVSVIVEDGGLTEWRD